MALREIYNFYDVILIRKSGEKSNFKNIARGFVLGITEMHPQNRRGTAKDVCVGIDKIFGENKLTWKCWPIPITIWDQTLVHLRMISLVLCSGLCTPGEMRCEICYGVEIVGHITKLLAGYTQSLPTFPGAEKELKPCILCNYILTTESLKKP